MTKFGREFLLASLVCLAFILWGFHKPLLTGQVSSMGQELREGRPSIAHMYEHASTLLPIYHVAARVVRRGVFPGWNHEAQGGTPLIGAMQGAVFAPLNLPLYLFPPAWLPWTLMLLMMLKAYASFAFAYLYARSLGLRLPAATTAGVAFAFAPGMFGTYLYPPEGTALYLPLLLLLVELHFRDYRRLSLFLLPWAVALPIFSGHFEIAARLWIVAGLYFALHLRAGKAPGPEKARRALAAAGAALAGLALAACQILPGMEYHKLSYNAAWRSLKEYGWRYQTITKDFSAADLPLMALGWAGAALFVLLLRRGLASEERRGARLAGAAALLALGLAALSVAGMDDPLLGVLGARDAAGWLATGLLAFFAGWGWAGADGGARFLGLFALGGAVVAAKAPPLSHLLSSLPIVGLFNNTVYLPEVRLALATLGAAGLQRAAEAPAGPWRERLRGAAGAFSVLAVVLAGYLGSLPLRGPVARLIPAAVNAQASQDGPSQGGIMSPDRRKAYAGGLFPLAGWIPLSPPAASVEAGVVEGQSLAGTVPAPARSSGGRRYFHAMVPLPASGEAFLAAKVEYAGRGGRILPGPRLSLYEPPPWWVPAAGLLLALLVLLAGPILPAAVYAPALAYYAWLIPQPAFPADQLPFRLPGIERIREDPSLFRITSLTGGFLPAGYASLYEVADIRNGNDNLDVLSLIYFVFFSHSLAGDARDARAREAGLSLLGLANVKYLVEPPGAGPRPGLERVHDGRDMTVFRNDRALPRAAFFEKAAVLPLPALSDWRARGKVFGALGSALSAGLDPRTTLLLHDRPASRPGPPGAGDPGEPEVRVEGYRPDRVRVSVRAPRPGFLFLSDNLFPGWRAVRDGERTELLRAWLTFRAVEVPAGRSVVEFVYEPFLLRATVLATVLLSAGWIVLYARWRRRRASRRDEPAAPPPARKKKAAPAPVEPAEGSEGCAAFAERLVLALVLPALLFWAGWRAFVYEEGFERYFRNEATTEVPSRRQPPSATSSRPASDKSPLTQGAGM